MRKEKIKIKFLGTAANGGIPQINCRCVNCVSNLVTRKRSSLLIKFRNQRLIIDCGPDFRTQVLTENLRLQDLSGIVLSHLHWDHCIGLMELAGGKPCQVPVLAANKITSKLTGHELFSFLFKAEFAKFVPEISVTNVNFIEIPHDPNFPTFAIKIVINDKKFLIATDIAKINKTFALEAKNSDLVIFDGTFLNKSKNGHVCIKESASILKKLNKSVIFTHINHSENSKEIISFLSKYGFKLAFDGMVVKI